MLTCAYACTLASSAHSHKYVRAILSGGNCSIIINKFPGFRYVKGSNYKKGRRVFFLFFSGNLLFNCLKIKMFVIHTSEFSFRLDKKVNFSVNAYSMNSKSSFKNNEYFSIKNDLENILNQ